MSGFLLPIAYAAPLAYWIPIAKGVHIVWEIHDHYEKQTYRNRTYIHAANGKQLLSVPIKSSCSWHAFFSVSQKVIDLKVVGYHIHYVGVGSFK